jgi:signal peptidase II
VLAVQGPRPLIPGLLDLHFTTNTGAAFSLLSGSTRLLGLISVLVALVVVVWILRQARRPMPLSRSLGLGLVLGGALGNGIDRWRLGEVVDFLALVPVSFPIFNIADVAINLAVLAFALELLLPQPSGDA